MHSNSLGGRLRLLLGPLVIAAIAASASSSVSASASDEGTVDFTSGRWTLLGGQIVEHLGRTCLTGPAVLQDVDLVDGVIEVDLALSWERSYPGIRFRIQPGRNYEEFYVRPHRGKFYTDALQYTPVFSGISCWQLYNGEGFTAGYEFPWDTWIPVRLEFAGTQARVFVGADSAPALIIPELKHGATSGAIGLTGPSDGSYYFSNFRYRAADDLIFDPPPPIDPSPGLIREWEISQALPLTAIDLATAPTGQGLGELSWEPVVGEPEGLVTIARWRGRTAATPDCIIARTTLTASEPRILPLSFGYSDLVSIFLNGQRVFLGNSAYRQRDPSFLGIVGLFDEVPLALRAGENELLLVVVEAFGGWGFICQDSDAIHQAPGVVQSHETPDEMFTPESVLYDPQRSLFYVSNYDVYRRAGPGGQFLSRLASSGEVRDLQWAVGLDRPTGMALSAGRLLVVERTALAVIDPQSGEITERVSFPDAQFPNDVACDDAGVAYISDAAADRIYRFDGETIEEWIGGGEIRQPNALWVDGDRLLVGSTGDQCIKAIDLASGTVTTLAHLPRGIIDGVRRDAAGNLLVSHWEGRVYRVLPDGTYQKLLDTSARNQNAADFEYLPEQDLLVIPTFMQDRVVLYHLGTL